MALDPLEKEQLRRRIATRMGMFLESATSVGCISGHYSEGQPALCELCQENHAEELLVVKNRAGKKLRVASECLLEMVRFKVTEVEELPRWLEKLKELKLENHRRKQEQERLRQENRKRLEKKVILRKRSPSA